MDAAIISRIAHEVSLPEASLAATVGLFESGATAPFVFRYRKEVTGGLDEAKIRVIQERYISYREVLDRRASILKLITDQGKLSDDLRARIEGSLSKVELEDLYHQFRPKKRTRAAEAIERGLEPLAEYLFNQEPDAWSLQEHIDVFVDPAKKVSSREQALQWATEIIAQWIGENIDFRKALREMLWSEGAVVSTVVPAKAEQKTKYNMYYNRREAVTTIPSHRVLAIRRGSKEGILTSSIEGDHTKAIEYLLSHVIRDKESAFAPILEATVREGYNRILRPLIETEVRAQLKERADREAIRVFQENLANLLLSPPAGQMVVAGLDTVKSGECTLAVVDARGNFLEGRVIRFSPPKVSTVKNSPAASKGSKAAPGTDVAVPSVLPAEAAATTLEVPQVARVSDPPVAMPLSAPVPSPEIMPGGEPSLPVAHSGPEIGSAAAADSSAEMETTTAIGVTPEMNANVAAPVEKATGPVSDETATPPAAPEANLNETIEAAPQPEAAVMELPIETGVTSPPVPHYALAQSEALPEPEVSVASQTAEAGPTAPPDSAAPAERNVEVEAAPVIEVPCETLAAEPPSDAIAGATATAAVSADTLPAPSAPAIDYMASARATIRELITKYGVQAVAIGTGMGARELESTLRQILDEERIEGVLVAAVNDAGVAVYSSSRVAREELPDLTVSARCAASLARRLQDPLAEMVKIDPKLIGVGQYQHDVDQKELHRGLLQTVQFCVNKVGVDVNTAGYSMLRYVAGLNDRLAHRIIGARNTSGVFPSREALLKVPGIDAGTFGQAAGFLRIRGGENPLDATAIHPESYPVVGKMAASLGIGISDLIGNKERISALKLEDFVDGAAGLPTLADIREELLRPGRDPRRTFALPKFRSDVKELTDLKKGMVLEGTVTNVTNFGAFVDIGVHQDGLVHLSQMSNRFIRDPREAVKVGDVVQVKVISVEAETKRIGLSMKALLPSGSRRHKRAHKTGGRPPQGEPPAKAAEHIPASPVAAGEAGKTVSAAPRERRWRRDRDHGRPRRGEHRRPDRPMQPAAPAPEPRGPEPSLHEKIAILQSKFRGIS